MGTVEIATSISNWCLNCIAILIFCVILITAWKFRRGLHDISLLLTYNTCLAALLSCLIVCIMTSSNLSSGFLTFNHDFCVFWGLLYDIFVCSVYHSYYLQALYRLFRVVFYKKKSLLKRSLFLLFIFGQWLLTILVLLPPIFLNWYTTLATELYCLVPYTDFLAETYHILVIYMIPLVSIIIVYIWITRFVREKSRTTTMLPSNQRQRNLRDLTVIKRIIILISILIALRFPTVIFMIYAIFVGHLYPYTFGIVGLITAVCMIFIGCIMIHITPQLRNNCFALIYRDTRVHASRALGPRLLAQTSLIGDPNRINQQTTSRDLQGQRTT